MVDVTASEKVNSLFAVAFIFNVALLITTEDTFVSMNVKEPEFTLAK